MFPSMVFSRFSLFMVSDLTLLLVLYRQLAFYTGDTGKVIAFYSIYLPLNQPRTDSEIS